MKTKIFALTFLITAIVSISTAQIYNNSQIPESINSDGSAPDPTAILDIQSTDKGVLFPRMTTAERTAISAPATGLLVYDLDTEGYWYHDGAMWFELSADKVWSETANGIYYNSGKVSVNTSFNDPNSNLYVFQPFSETGPDKAGIFSYRSGYSFEPDSGGTSFSVGGIDAAIKGYSDWGNGYTAAVAGLSYLDYVNSAAVLGGTQSGLTYGALGFQDSTQIWAGYFNGDVRFRPASSYSPELYLDIVREYQDQGEFGQWHQLYVLPNARNTNAPDYDFYYLGDNTHHFDGLYCNAINPESSLFINGNTIVPGANKLGVGTGLPGRKLHVKQDIGNHAIRSEHHTTTDYWDTGTGSSTKNYKFVYNGAFMADVASLDGSYVIGSDASLKTDIEYLDNVLTGVLALKPAKYYYKSSRELAEQKSHGFIAQEVKAVFPELIRKREDGKYALAYDDFGVLAIKAIQEQQEIIEQQNEKLLKLENELNEIKALLKK